MYGKGDSSNLRLLLEPELKPELKPEPEPEAAEGGAEPAPALEPGAGDESAIIVYPQ
jgi:hypothetical protein